MLLNFSRGLGNVKVSGQSPHNSGHATSWIAAMDSLGTGT
jgi:hypothetical protein